MIYFIRQITYKVYNIDILSFYHNFFPHVYMEKFLSLPFSIFHFSKSIEKLKVHIVLWYILFFLFPEKYIYFCFHISLLRFLASCYCGICGIWFSLSTMFFSYYEKWFIWQELTEQWQFCYLGRNMLCW